MTTGLFKNMAYMLFIFDLKVSALSPAVMVAEVSYHALLPYFMVKLAELPIRLLIARTSMISGLAIGVML